MADAPLLERDGELARLAELAHGVRHGRGAVVVVDGDPGMGKTSLLASTERDAVGAGLQLLTARGRELEQDLPYGVVQQLFSPLHRESDPAARADDFAGPAACVEPVLVGATPDADAFALRHGLYWLLANATSRGAFLLTVDDAQWADRVSLRFLAYAAERIDELPVLLVLTARRSWRGIAELETLAGRTSTVRLTLAALSPDACGAVVRAGCPKATPTFVAACADGTGGNPLLLRQVVDEARRLGAGDDDARLASLRLEHVGETALGRIANLDPGVAMLAQAAAVVGEGGQLRHAADIASLEISVAELHADALSAADILLPGHEIRFSHPVVADGIRNTVPAGRRSGAHRRAARLLAGEGSDAAACMHLLHVAPAADPWVVSSLRSQARRALSGGAADVAETLLRRALEEPPEGELRSAVLAELGEAELQLGDANAMTHLREARELARSGDDIERSSRLLAMAYAVNGPLARSADVLADAVRALAQEPSDHSARLQAELLAFAQLEHSAAARTGEQLRALAAAAACGDTAVERILLAAYGYSQALLWASPAAEAAGAFATSVNNGLLTDVEPDSPIIGVTLIGLVQAGSWGLAAEAIEQTARLARERGRTRALAQAMTVGSRLARLQGDLIRAETDARLAVRLSAQSFPMLLPNSLAVLVMALSTRGDLETARDVLTEHDAWGDVPPTTPGATLLLARAELQHALRNSAAAAAEVDRMQGFVQARGDYPQLWVPDIVEVLTGAGRVDEALALAEQHHQAAELWQLPVDRAEALRCLARVRGGNDVDLLEQAAALLDEGASPLIRTKVLRDLGAALRRANRRSDARGPLLEALDLASRMRSQRLVDDITAELAAAGMHPRRSAQTGVDAMTASEHRIAALAATGLSNPEIAQTLFITRKTVEKHLASTFRKLGIASRTDLAGALDPA
jgi:DNA-binding NarL/FixJ family response regulator